ncbi:Abi family protein [Eubacterium maltosivorans]|uniref:Abi family protein n=1 Tax=Eubacterium maltosivorans TaxID=2041044 RepID=UPI00189FF088|nr:Abi family protein [Eubacterium maltosivorans]
MDKNFLTYNQQMKYLRESKKITCGGSADKTILCRAGYFNLVNGYKTPFVSGLANDGKHIYHQGTSIKSLYALKIFDEELRCILLRYITKAEEEIRTFTAYKFDEVNKYGGTAWYQVDAYDPKCDVKNIIAVISKAYSEISRSRLDYVEFYMSNHKVIPTWILVKVINFSTFIDFLKCSKQDVLNALCELYNMKDRNNGYYHKLLIGSLHWMRLIRNSCAHNERVYDIHPKINSKGGKVNSSAGRILCDVFDNLPLSYTRDKRRSIFDLFVYLKYFLDKKDYCTFIKSIYKHLSELRNDLSSPAFDNVRADMGIKKADDLLLLINDHNKINYNNF